MPTLYTSLRAQHRHKLVAKPQPVPAPKKPIAEMGLNLLATEKAMMLASGAHIPAAPKTGKRRKHVVVVGGGLAGLCAAYELRGLHYDVTVYEARDRLGGRVFSIDDFVPNKSVEGGGELIGTNHPLWNLYAKKFGLYLLDVKDYGHSPVRLQNQTLSFKQSEALTDELEVQLKLLSNLAESIVDPFEPWINPNARHLDAISIGDWIQKAKCSPQCKRALTTMLEADNGISANEQSMLGVLAMIKGGGLDRYWTDTELYRCEGGNSRLAEKFRERLDQRGGPRVFTDAQVKTISCKNGDILVEVLIAGKVMSPNQKVDDIILAIPPSVYDRIVFGDPQLSKKLAAAPGLGSNVKYLMRLDSRFWQDFGSSPNLSEDGPVNLTWETTEDDDPGTDYAFVAFSGGADADQCVAWAPRARKKQYVAALNAPYPTISRHLKQERFMSWPTEEWTRGSYYFPRKNEVTEWGPFWRAGWGGWLHFAGEHTSYAFMGYMEGALSSGYRLARRLAVRDNEFAA